MSGMIHKIRGFLQQPYPFYFEGKTLWYLVLVIGSMAILFIYFFQPFSVYEPEHKMSFFMITVMHSAAAVLMILFTAGLVKLIPGYSDFWTVEKESIFLIVMLILIGVGQFLIRDLIYDNPNNWSWGYLLEEVRNTFLIGILFVIILVPLNHNYLKTKNSRKAAQLQMKRKHGDGVDPIQIKTQLKQDDFEMDISDFLFARAEGNYVEFHLKSGQEASQKFLKRISLKDLEEQLSPIPNIVKTHRSYLVNLNYVQTVSGNAQGYTLELQNTKEPIAVSRGMIPAFEAGISST